MKFRTILAACAVSMMPLVANALTLLDKSHAGNSFDLIADSYQFQDTFVNGESGPLTFTFENTSATYAVVTISSASIAQLPNSYFTGGASVEWTGAGLVTSAAQGGSSGGNISFILAANSSDVLTLNFGTVVVGTNNPDIDFLVSAEAVPVPAGILLMGTAIAGFGVMRRRKKAA